MTQKRIGELFGVGVPAISKHLKNIFEAGELLERVRSIRASERRIYQQITDIFAECSIDYDPKSETTRNFYAHVLTGNFFMQVLDDKSRMN